MGHTMRLLNNEAERERGQALILFTLALCTLLLCAMAVIDVGFFLHNRENAQQTADAAALAGAQDLPGNASQAQTDALAYITKNGMSTANTTISFTCTSQNPSVCTSNSGTYDTIVVTQKAKSPTYFGGVLSVLGISNCWVTGCTSSATAAGCRGACGGQISTPLDVVIDH
jgi:Flp pilus assembly protein TadG